MYDHILVPTDGSDAVDAAVEEALSLATLSEAVVHALYVEERAGDLVAPGGNFLTVEGTVAERGERAVADVRHRALEAGVDAETEVRTGDPAEQIAAYARDNADAVVMATHGRSGVRRVMLGSVAERVIRRAEVPVVVTRARS